MNEDLRGRIGERLKRLMKGRLLDRKGVVRLVAEKTGKKLDYSLIGKIERGDQYTSLKTLERLARSLAVPVGYFFGDGEKTPAISITKEELVLLRELRGLNKAEKRIITRLIKRFGIEE